MKVPRLRVNESRGQRGYVVKRGDPRLPHTDSPILANCDAKFGTAGAEIRRCRRKSERFGRRIGANEKNFRANDAKQLVRQSLYPSISVSNTANR